MGVCESYEKRTERIEFLNTILYMLKFQFYGSSKGNAEIREIGDIGKTREC